MLTDVKDVWGEVFAVYALRNDNTLWGWSAKGLGLFGEEVQLSNSMPIEVQSTPIKIMDEVKTAALNRSVGYAIKQDGSLWAWGANEYGAVGDGTQEDRYTPVKVMDGVRSMTGSSDVVRVLKEDQSLWAWGYNFQGNCGTGSNENVLSPYKVMDDVQKVSGSSTPAVLKTDGTLWVCGDDTRSIDGGDEKDRDGYTFLSIANNVKDISREYFCGGFIKNDGTL